MIKIFKKVDYALSLACLIAAAACFFYYEKQTLAAYLLLSSLMSFLLAHFNVSERINKAILGSVVKKR